MPNLDRASRLLQDLPALWNHPGVTAALQRGLAREVFQEVRLREGRLVAVRPRPRYAPLFAYALCAMASACCRWCAFILSWRVRPARPRWA